MAHSAPPLESLLDVLHCKTPHVFGACVELLLSFGTADVLCCKTPLKFGTSLELQTLIDNVDVLDSKILKQERNPCLKK